MDEIVRSALRRTIESNQMLAGAFASRDLGDLLDPIRRDARFRQFIADSADAYDARRRALLPLVVNR